MLLPRTFSFASQLLKANAGTYSTLENEKCLEEAIDWLCRAQDATPDGGVSAYYSWTKGWAPSFIETTGYIIGTFLNLENYNKKTKYLKRVERMGDYLLSMQLTDGSFRAYAPQQKKDEAAIIFNTGQDLLGVSDYFYFSKNKKYLESSIKCADFLITVQNQDGSWTELNYDHDTHAYHTRVAWGLVKVYFLTSQKKYLNSAIRNLDWTLTLQRENGWFEKACLPHFDSTDPITHTLAYTLEGLLFSGLLLEKDIYIDRVLTTLRLLASKTENKPLFATYNSKWQATSNYICLTGAAQFSILWWYAYFLTGDYAFKKAAQRVLATVKKTQSFSSWDSGIRGGVAGSFPLLGDIKTRQGYCRLAYINWATKFYSDALLLEIMEEDLLKKNFKGTYVYS